MSKLTIEIPDELMSRLKHQGYVLQDVVVAALERYIETEAYANPEAKLAEFDRLSRKAGLEAEAEGLTEEQLEEQIEAIKEDLYQQTYG